jgi:hypothetical protein
MIVDGSNIDGILMVSIEGSCDVAITDILKEMLTTVHPEWHLNFETRE